MKKSRYAESQIIGVLKEVDAGLSVVKACLFVGIGRATFYRPERDWRKADAAVINAINAVLEKSSRAGSGSVLVECGSKAFPSTTSASIAFTARWD